MGLAIVHLLLPVASPCWALQPKNMGHRSYCIKKPGKEQYIAVCRSSIQPLFPLPRLFPGAEPTHPCLDKYKHLVALPQTAHSYPRASNWNTLQLCPFYPVTSCLSASHLCSHIIFTMLYPCYVMNNTTLSACPLHPLSCPHPRFSFSLCF